MTMTVHDDKNAFDSGIHTLAYTLAEQLAEILLKKGVDKQTARDILDDAMWSIAMIFDQADMKSYEGTVFRPVLTFELSDGRMIYGEGGSYLHEYSVALGEELIPD